MEEKLIDKTKGLCPQCLEWVDTDVLVRGNGVFLEKRCSVHEHDSVFLSGDAQHFIELRNFYFKIHNKIFPQQRHQLFLTPKCNLSCPACFLDPHSQKEKDIYLEELTKTLKNNTKEIILFGAEPTCRNDLFEIIKHFKSKYCYVSMFTNGIKLISSEYNEQLKESGLDKIFLSFDGFDEPIYKALRGEKLVDVKLKVLDKLKTIGIPIILNAVIAKDINKDSVGEIFKYALENRFIKGITYIAYSCSGLGRDYLRSSFLMPDDVIGYLAQQTDSRITRSKIRVVQKLLFVYMSILKRRTCVYIQHFWVYRKKNAQYLTLDEIINFDLLEKILDEYADILSKKGGVFAKLYLTGKLPIMFFLIKNFKVCLEMIKMVLFHCLKFGEYTKQSGNFLQLTFSTGCDVNKADLKISQCCDVGMIYKNDNGEIIVDDENAMYMLNQDIKNHKEVRS